MRMTYNTLAAHKNYARRPGLLLPSVWVAASVSGDPIPMDLYSFHVSRSVRILEAIGSTTGQEKRDEPLGRQGRPDVGHA